MVEKSKVDSWNPSLYDAKHSFVSKFGQSIIELLKPSKDERILDIGCGTGDLTNRIATQTAYTLGIDFSERMITQAKQKYPNIPFQVCDATNMNFSDEFDAVFSNAALHWIKPPHKALTCIHSSLKTGGRFVAEFGGKGNVQLIIASIEKQLTEHGFADNLHDNPWFFPSLGEYTSMMELYGFRVVFAQHFDRPTPLVNDEGMTSWLMMFANCFFKGINDSLKQEIITKVVEDLSPVLCKDGVWIADYKRLRVVGIKM
ncbi:class I SAM-dependent methyltransferase [Metabacillus malikii]|uniref:Ubiquinone/menaquinone biosynthesis C-methylase UbiE n=1 Tax=Metabacillus malikii TaxID=1504265 RepID=A0ABT9ZAQ7_9BACI|nr:class I SAM-dependent methyltransferase [Metabacillus malikii]MDQ0229346.1 ubiquinone/menaquinone biosynthesis C-methylase UbiE [Metabacillus malikii]